MIWGIIAIILCIFLSMKIVSRKMKWTKVDKMIRRIHIPCGVLVLVVILTHLIVTRDVWPTRSVWVIGTGITTAVLLLLMALGYVFRKKLKGRWIVLHRVGATLIALLIVCHVFTYYVDLLSYKRDVSAINVKGIDAGKVKDGTYEGEYDVGYIYAKVEITVRKGTITDINIVEHDNERGAPAEAVVDDIIEQQTTKVDAVSGATNSSLVIEKAVENALESK
jgi:uncharacterized protein with FMN-binding domain